MLCIVVLGDMNMPTWLGVDGEDAKLFVTFAANLTPQIYGASVTFKERMLIHGLILAPVGFMATLAMRAMWYFCRG